METLRRSLAAPSLWSGMLALALGVSAGCELRRNLSSSVGLRPNLCNDHTPSHLLGNLPTDLDIPTSLEIACLAIRNRATTATIETAGHARAFSTASRSL